MTSATPDLEAAIGQLLARTRTNAVKQARALAECCTTCWGPGPVRLWPQGQQIKLCGTCWTDRARGEIVADWRGRVVYVFSTHPQYGELLRGTIRAAGIVPRGVQPTIRWRISDYDAHDLDAFAGDYVDAERMLLDATTELDQITTDTQGD